MNDEEKLKKLQSQVEKLSSLLDKMSKDGVVYFINIEKLEFQGPVLDALEFIFDKIDVKEVSGALNLGNNFGVSVEGKNNKIKPSGLKVKEKKNNEDENPKSKENSSNNINVQTYSEKAEKMEKKLEQVFKKAPKHKKTGKRVKNVLKEKDALHPSKEKESSEEKNIAKNPQTTSLSEEIFASSESVLKPEQSLAISKKVSDKDNIPKITINHNTVLETDSARKKK
ncbi:hypothetical protein [Lederbergia citri]|uniref:Uncharacterized protein n=1 Tax=Lederbergia citri TaxID=2833580 RepID=A0A942T9H1_9BACI|nr:hypothetical protein [Lederbergia citri]MBS4193736.1 hypothetical protein [Lederbergia citri]